MADNVADVIIVGAGVAGLTAASELSAAGRHVIVVEGRGRIGGRIETVHDPAWPLPIERGAEFIHGRPREILDILRASGCLSYDIADRHHVFSRGRLRKDDGFFEEVEEVLALAGKVRRDMSFAECLKRYGGKFGARQRAAARSFVEGFDAADVNEVSCRWLQESNEASEEIEGDRLGRFYAGYDRLTNFLRTGVPEARHRIELSATVARIDWSGSQVEVLAMRAGDGAVSFVAPKVLVTVPVSILQLAAGHRGRIAFDPPLPAKKMTAIHLLRLGPVVKVILRFREAVWEKIDADLNFFHVPGGDAAFPTWWTTLPIRTTVLTGWAGGPAAARLAGKSAAEILEVATVTLGRLLKIPVRKLKGEIAAAHVGDWQSEALSRGAYSYAVVGGAGAARDLARPVRGRLYFAGEATETGLTGTVAAAIASGRVHNTFGGS
jgi:monoamine oxidase